MASKSAGTGFVRNMSARRKIARWISIVGHPFSSAILLVLSVSWSLHGGQQAWRTTAIVIAVMILPLWLFVWNRYSTGRWQTVDASSSADRPALYTVSFILMGLLSLYLLTFGRQGETMRGLTAVASLLGIAAILNRWIKLSVHLAFATFAAVILLRLIPPIGWILVCYLPTLGWSRLVLSRHTFAEVIGGFVLGGGVAVCALFL